MIEYYNWKPKGMIVLFVLLSLFSVKVLAGSIVAQGLSLSDDSLMGYKANLGSKWRIAAEFNIRKTFTDYLDDVSGLYYDNDAIRAQGGAAAAHFADPSGGEGGAGRVGAERGFSEHKDNYFLTGMRLEIPLGRGRGGNFNTSCSFGNSWIRSNGSLPKIGRKGKRRRVRLFR